MEIHMEPLIHSLVHHINSAVGIADKLKMSELGESLRQTNQDVLSSTFGNGLDTVDMVEQAYDILKTESKPGPTLVANKLNISKAEANKLFKVLIDSGRIVKGQVAEPADKGNGSVKDEPKQESKKSKGSPKGKAESKAKARGKAKSKPTDSSDIMSLIAELPEGDDLLIPAHLQPLICLEEGVRAQYLSGLKVEDLVTSDDIARGSVNGVNTMLVDEIKKLTRSRRPKVKDADIIKCSKDGNDREQKYFNHRARSVKAIPHGKELYKHMAANGLTLGVLRDLKTIAQVSVKGQV